MALSSFYRDILYSLDCYSDKEKKTIEEEFSLMRITSDRILLSDLNIVAGRLKAEGKIESNPPSYETLCKVAESIMGSGFAKDYSDVPAKGNVSGSRGKDSKENYEFSDDPYRYGYRKVKGRKSTYRRSFKGILYKIFKSIFK